jgi:hypothetical protein
MAFFDLPSFFLGLGIGTLLLHGVPLIIRKACGLFDPCRNCAYDDPQDRVLILQANCVGCYGHADRPHRVPAGPDAPDRWSDYHKH